MTETQRGQGSRPGSRGPEQHGGERARRERCRACREADGGGGRGRGQRPRRRIAVAECRPESATANG
eukprot:3117257-Rhodomonas_salina.1